MDPRYRGYPYFEKYSQLRNQSLLVHTNPNAVVGPRFENSVLDSRFEDFHYLPPDPLPSNIVCSSSNITSSSSVSHDENSPEDCDFSDTVLGYISQILMEEDMEGKTCMLQDSLDLQVAEKSFYDVLGKKYPSPDKNMPYSSQYSESLDDNSFGDYYSYLTDIYSDNAYTDSAYFRSDTQNQHLAEDLSQIDSLPSHVISQSVYSSSNSVMSSFDGLMDSSNSSISVPESSNGSQSVWQFRKGVEEANRFLPNENELFLNLEETRLLKGSTASDVIVKVESKGDNEFLRCESRGRKNPLPEDGDLEEKRSNKQAAIFTDSILRSEMFDIVLLCSAGEGMRQLAELRDNLQIAKRKSLEQSGQSKGYNGGRGGGKKQSAKKEVVDLRTLLIHCAQAVAADDHRNASELLRKIRQHSSPFGDGNQRLAQCFAEGLEARLAGTGSQIYKGLVCNRTSAADLLKAYHLFLAACPFRKISNFTSNKTIMSIAANSGSIHVIDFGILYGFQWPTLIQRLSWREGGPPKLRITGIEFPQPGFRPAQRVEETGRRLSNYAETFKVPFEYNAVAKNWETISIEDLKIEGDEVLVVNCLYRAKNLHDESVTVESARNNFLHLVRKINPSIFIHGVVNGAYNAPFFVTRFREALFHYSALFDMLETVVPREDGERMLIEKEIFGREALNVIACEGWERVERPETYKQWQVRIMRAGFLQLEIDRVIMKTAIEKVRSSYHKDFVIDEDRKWMLQGWKGRTVYALSAWKPV